MSFVVEVSQAERTQGFLHPEVARVATQTLHEQGAVLLRGVFPVEAIDVCYREFAARYGDRDVAQMTALSEMPPPNPVMQVGAGRFEIALRMTGAFGHPDLYANPVLLNFLRPQLGGADMRLSGFTAVASYPGAAAQHHHRDHDLLYSEHAGLTQTLPIYAVNVSVPLVDVDLAIGPTGIWLGSHRWPEDAIPNPDFITSVPFQRGDCILMDYRTLHIGVPNRSQVMRPILYLVYSRIWFFDDVNHYHRAPLDMPHADFEQLPTTSSCS